VAVGVLGEQEIRFEMEESFSAGEQRRYRVELALYDFLGSSLSSALQGHGQPLTPVLVSMVALMLGCACFLLVRLRGRRALWVGAASVVVALVLAQACARFGFVRREAELRLRIASSEAVLAEGAVSQDRAAVVGLPLEGPTLLVNVHEESTDAGPDGR
jgi:hypothetical protein